MDRGGLREGLPRRWLRVQPSGPSKALTETRADGKRGRRDRGTGRIRGTRFREAVPGAFGTCVCDPWRRVSPQSRSIGLNPLYVMLPCTLSASFAFMLPVATPPNAIVFAYGHLKVSDMVTHDSRLASGVPTGDGHDPCVCMHVLLCFFSETFSRSGDRSAPRAGR